MTDQTPALADRLRRRLPRGARRVARALRDRSPLRRLVPPTVSIIVPIYNVEQYLAECLDSIAAQTFGGYEVLVVDDGSPDGSRAIAEQYAAADPRIRVIVRENGGLGAARNTGIEHARGRFLTFVDSDDLLPPNALQALVGSATRTGSDVVVGSVRRFDSVRAWRPSWVDEVHGVPRPGIRVEEFLPLMRNLYTWDKLYRHDFWKAQGLRFREGVAYEDQPIVTQLLARASSIDVISEVVYHYRARDDRSSISQQTSSLRDLRDRIAAWRISRDALLAEGAARCTTAGCRPSSTPTSTGTSRVPGPSTTTYWAELRAAVAELTEDAPGALWDATDPRQAGAARAHPAGPPGRRAGVRAADGRRADRWPATVRGDGVLLSLPFLDDPDLDENLFLIRPEQLRVAHSVENFHWHTDPGQDGTCSVSGWAFIEKIDLAEHASEVWSSSAHARTGSEDDFAVDRPSAARLRRPRSTTVVQLLARHVPCRGSPGRPRRRR